MKLTRAKFRWVYQYNVGNDIENADNDYYQYMRTGEIPKYMLDQLKKEELSQRRL